jgi:hypothetical protein
MKPIKIQSKQTDLQTSTLCHCFRFENTIQIHHRSNTPVITTTTIIIIIIIAAIFALQHTGTESKTKQKPEKPESSTWQMIERCTLNYLRQQSQQESPEKHYMSSLLSFI